jgi:hypothetical protein
VDIPVSVDRSKDRVFICLWRFSTRKDDWPGDRVDVQQRPGKEGLSDSSSAEEKGFLPIRTMFGKRWSLFDDSVSSPIADAYLVSAEQSIVPLISLRPVVRARRS